MNVLKSLFVSHIYATFCPRSRSHLKENFYCCSWAWIICPVVFITTGLNTLNLTHNAIWRWNRSLAGMCTCFHYTDWKNVWRVEPSKVKAVAEKTCVFTSKHFCFALVKLHLLLLQSPAVTCCWHTHFCISAWPKHQNPLYRWTREVPCLKCHEVPSRSHKRPLNQWMKASLRACVEFGKMTMQKQSTSVTCVVSTEVSEPLGLTV